MVVVFEQSSLLSGLLLPCKDGDPPVVVGGAREVVTGARLVLGVTEVVAGSSVLQGAMVVLGGAADRMRRVSQYSGERSCTGRTHAGTYLSLTTSEESLWHALRRVANGLALVQHQRSPAQEGRLGSRQAKTLKHEYCGHGRTLPSDSMGR